MIQQNFDLQNFNNKVLETKFCLKYSEAEFIQDGGVIL